MAKMISRPILGLRLLSYSTCLLKDKNSKQQMEKLGAYLQKGNINSVEGGEQQTNGSVAVKHSNDAKEAEKMLNERQELSSKIDECYNLVSHMSVNDIIIQQNLDEGTQFSFPSEHYLDRKRILNDIPDEIDLFNTPFEVIQRSYEDLEKLDNDKSVHLKYYKRYLSNYTNPINNLIQDFNGISKKFKLKRRRELDSLILAPGAYLFKENIFNNTYNVVGFDRSISGLPLRNGRDKLTDACYPTEFVEDLQMFRTKIPIHKRDLDFVEYEENSLSIEPSRVQQFGELRNNKHQLNDLEEVYRELTSPLDSVVVQSVDDYTMLTLKSDVATRIESEILLMRGSLQQEIENMKSVANELKSLSISQELKTNNFRLCETRKPETLNSSLIIINYKLKPLNTIPNYAFLNNSRSQRNRLYRHLFKMFLINIEEQVNRLTQIKFHTEKKTSRFISSLHGNIEKTISFKLMKHFSTLKDVEFKNIDALIYRPQRCCAFKRIYWVKPTKRVQRDKYRNSKYRNRVALAGFEQFSER